LARFCSPAEAAFLLLALLGLTVAFSADRNLYHGLAEVLSVGMALAIPLFIVSAHRFVQRGFITLLGWGFLGVAALEALHLYYHTTMMLGSHSLYGLAGKLWVSTRLVQGISLVLAPMSFDRTTRPRYSPLLMVLAVGLMALVFYGWVPVAYERVFWRICEGGVLALLAGALFFMWWRRGRLESETVVPLLAATGLALTSAIIFFTVHTSSGEAVGHMISVLSFFMVYRGVVGVSLARPYRTIFREIKASEDALRADRDSLQEQFVQAQKMEAIGRLAGGLAHDGYGGAKVEHLRGGGKVKHPQI